MVLLNTLVYLTAMTWGGSPLTAKLLPPDSSKSLASITPRPGADKVTNFPPLPLIDGDKIIEAQPDQVTLTERYVDSAKDFIDRNQDEPFFLVLCSHVCASAHLRA